MMKKILFVGETLIDLISRDYIGNIRDAQSFSPSFGGSPANISVMLGDMGINPMILTRVGTDPFGEEIISHMEKRGVDIKYVQIDRYYHTSMVLIAKSRDYHDFLPLRGADYRLEPPPSGILNDVEFLHLSSWPLTASPSRDVVLKLWNDARKKGIKLSFDPNYREKLNMDNVNVKDMIKDLIQDVFLIKPSLEDAYELLGEKTPHEYIEEFHHFGIRNVVLSLGREGVIISDGNMISHFPSLAKNPVDTTGGGDGLWCGIYYGLINDLTLLESVKIGSMIAAYVIERESASEKIPSLDMLKRKYLQKEVKI